MLAFRGCVQSIGTQFDSGDNRREIKRLRSVIKKKIGDSEGSLKEMHGRSALTGVRALMSPLSISSVMRLLTKDVASCLVSFLGGVWSYSHALTRLNSVMIHAAVVYVDYPLS